MDKSQYLIKMPTQNHVLVLGASGAIGSETVRALAANGAEMITIGYGGNQTSAEALKAEIEAWGVKAFIAKIDRSSEELLATTLDTIVETAGREVTTLVDCIGVSPNIPFKDLTFDDARKVYEVNVLGCIFSTKVVAERMAAKRVADALIVLLGSTNGMNSFSAQSLPYDLSKQNIHGITESLSEEYASLGIRIIGIAFGWINTGMNDSLPAGMLEREVGFVYMARQGTAIEAGKFITSTIMDSHSYVTGTVLKMDGGYPRRNPPRKQ